MSVANAVRLNGVLVHAAVAGDPAAPRVRVSADDWERLGLGRGAVVTLDVPDGRPTAVGYVESDTFVDPCWVWVQLAPVRAATAARPRRPVRVPVV